MWEMLWLSGWIHVFSQGNLEPTKARMLHEVRMGKCSSRMIRTDATLDQDVQERVICVRIPDKKGSKKRKFFFLKKTSSKRFQKKTIEVKKEKKGGTQF